MGPSVFRLAMITFVLWLMPLIASAQAAAGLDQYQLSSDINLAIHANTSPGQWFTVGTDGLLYGAEFGLSSSGSVSEDLVVEVFDFTGGSLGALRGSTTMSASDLGPVQDTLDVNSITATLIPLEHLNIVVNSGETIAILLTSAVTLPDLYGVYAITTDSYPNGQYVTHGGTAAHMDLMFKIFVARPVFADDFESGNTSAWSTTQP